MGTANVYSSFSGALPLRVSDYTRLHNHLVPGNVSLFQDSLSFSRTCPRDHLDFASDESPRENGKRARVSTVEHGAWVV